MSCIVNINILRKENNLSQSININVRAVAASILERIVTDGYSMKEAITVENPDLDARDQAFLREIIYGVCRHYWTLEFFAGKLMSKPLKPKETLVRQLIYVGLYQLLHCRLPAYAAIAETVEAVRVVNKPWAVGLVNAVLRQFQRQEDELQAMLADNDVAKFSHPKWLVKRIQNAWPTNYAEIFMANNQHAPMTIRVNRRQGTRDEYIARCDENDVSTIPLAPTNFGLTLTKTVGVEQLPGFGDGACYVQDGASQLIESLLDLQPEQRVLDACAAPGGKTTLLLEAEPSLKIVAIDSDQSRIKKIQENLERLKLTAKVKVGDCLQPSTWWDENQFDRILIDAPCSATGVIRRHPDIKLLRRKSDMSELVAVQRQLVEALWPLLKSGGRMLYTTCSILPEENEQVMMDFLSQQADANALELDLPLGTVRKVGIQLLPGEHDMDGFYYAVLEKV